jgi:hypothetical protein
MFGPIKMPVQAPPELLNNLPTARQLPGSPTTTRVFAPSSAWHILTAPTPNAIPAKLAFNNVIRQERRRPLYRLYARLAAELVESRPEVQLPSRQCPSCIIVAGKICAVVDCDAVLGMICFCGIEMGFGILALSSVYKILSDGLEMLRAPAPLCLATA